MKLLQSLSITLLCAVITPLSTVVASPDQAKPATANPVSDAPAASITEADPEADHIADLGPHLKLLNELSPQRRTSRFFVNEQSARYGVQEGYVNVGRGNLTFVLRDLVTVGRIPIVAGRVYDSSADSGDFGPGWRFTLAETLTASGGVYLPGRKRLA